MFVLLVFEFYEEDFVIKVIVFMKVEINEVI